MVRTLRRISSDFVGKPILTSENQFLRRISSDFFFGFFWSFSVFFSHVLFFLVFLENFHDDLGFNDLIIY